MSKRKGKMQNRFQVIIAGSRDFNDYDLLSTKCDFLFSQKKPTKIISGCANGADKLRIRYAKDNGIEVLEFPADWDKHGKSAGYIRNTEMLKYADALIAFWDGKSKGTKHMISIAKKKDIQTRVIKW